jgi:hypothetical protein
MLTQQHFAAVRRVRQEADRLRLVCIGAAGKAALLHIAFDQGIIDQLPLDHTLLVGRLRNLP